MVFEKLNHIRLRAKILLAVLLVWGLMLLWGYIQAHSLEKNYALLENKLAVRDMDRIHSAIAAVVDSLAVQSANWGVWDDSYAFSQDKNKAFVEKNFTNEAVAPTNSDIVLLYDFYGRPIFIKAFNKERTKEVPAPDTLINAFKPHGMFFKFIDKPAINTVLKGLVLTEEGMLMLASHTILHSDRTGPVRGTWINVAHFTPELRQKIEDTTKLPFEIFPITTVVNHQLMKSKFDKLMRHEKVLDKIDKNTLVGYTLLMDPRNEPIGLLKVTLSRNVYSSGITTIHYFNQLFLLSGILFAALLFRLLRKLIIQRLEMINEKVVTIRETHDFAIRVPVNGADELASLGNETNKMLAVIEDYDKKNQDLFQTVSHELDQASILSKELKKAEKFLSSIINAMPSALLLMDYDKKIFQMNDEAKKMAEQFSGIVEGGSVLQLFPFLSDYKKEMEKAIKTEKIQAINKLIYSHNHGTSYFNVVMYPLPQQKKLALRIDDISPQMKLQEKMVQNEKLASIGVLTAGVAHEINNPLNFILSAVAPLRADLKDLSELIHKYEQLKNATDLPAAIEELRRLGESLDTPYISQEINQLMVGIQDGINRTVTITKDLQSASHSDDGKMQEINVHEGLDACLTLLANRYKNRIEIVRYYGAVSAVCCFGGRLNQIFMNILSNAIDAIPDKGQIVITSRKKNENHIVITIADTGSGINPESLTKIFDPFFTTKEVGRGTGLGLSITRTIIEDMGGGIEVSSQLGQGTEFAITLPTVVCPVTGG